MSDEKKSLLGSSVLNFIANIASKSIDPAHQEASKSMEVQEHLIAEEIEINQSLALNFRADLKLSKESDSESSNLAQNLDIVTHESYTLKTPDVVIEPAILETSFEFKLLSKAEKEFESSQLGAQNVTKGCKWSPDGTCLLTNSEDTTLRLFDLNVDMLNQEEIEVKELSPSLRMTEPEIIYDFAWYPFMNSSDPITACIFSTSKDNPVHLYDAYTGQIRCSYKGYNHMDELVNAYSIAFDSTGSKIYCGYKKSIKIFDISLPGKNFQDVKLFDDQYKMPGIVSCIAFSKAQNGVYAAGSYTKYIGIFVENTNEPVCLIQSHKGGLTHLKFSSDGNKLFSGSRKDSDIYCWDIRNPGKLLQIFKRDVQTNQRVYFDIYEDCKYLASGNNDGTVRLWNANEFDISKEDEPVLASFKAHNDCVNGISFHPSLKLMATSSGQRKLTNFDVNTSSESEDESEKKIFISENSLKIWKHCL